MRDYLPELLALSLFPLLHAQGRRARLRTERMAAGAGACSGIAKTCDGVPAARAPLRLLAVGESPVAGIGVSEQQQAVTAQLAAVLSARMQCNVHWRACGQNGATVRDACAALSLVPAEPVDVLLVAFGVNDTTAFHTVSRWHADVLALLDALQAKCRPRLILLSGVPPVGDFPALPQPLRAVMGMKAAALDRVLIRLAATRPATVHVPLRLNVRDATLMARDGFHPSATGCRVWSELLAQACLERHGLPASAARWQEDPHA